MWIETTNKDEIVAHVIAGETFNGTMCDRVVIHQLDESINDVVYSVIQVNNSRIKIVLSLTSIKFREVPDSIKKLVDEMYFTVSKVRVVKEEVWHNV